MWSFCTTVDWYCILLTLGNCHIKSRFAGFEIVLFIDWNATSSPVRLWCARTVIRTIFWVGSIGSFRVELYSYSEGLLIWPQMGLLTWSATHRQKDGCGFCFRFNKFKPARGILERTLKGIHILKRRPDKQDNKKQEISVIPISVTPLNPFSSRSSKSTY